MSCASQLTCSAQQRRSDGSQLNRARVCTCPPLGFGKVALVGPLQDFLMLGWQVWSVGHAVVIAPAADVRSAFESACFSS